jgi:two-component system, OmpR family, response regulator CpxR
MTTKRPVLLVDDDADMREAIRISMEDEGYEMVEASDGQEALDYLRSHPPPPVILLDWNMAPMNGPQFMAEVSKSSELAEVPVIVLTADARAPEKVKRQGYAGCLTKPFQLDALFELLRRYCA